MDIIFGECAKWRMKLKKCETAGFETFTFALSFCVRCRSASITATWLFIFEEEEKWRSFQKLKTAAQATEEVYASAFSLFASIV